MAEVFAGFVCGYALALVSAPLLAITVLRARASSPVLDRLLPPGTPAVPLMVVLHGGLIIFWTGLGILLGLGLLAMDRHAGTNGGRHNAFALVVAALTVAIVGPISVLFRRFRKAAILAGAVVLVAFGLVMPHLADWTTFGQ